MAELPMIPLEISRGASETFHFTMADPDGGLYYLQEGEVLRFGVKRYHSSPDFLIKKVLTAADLKDGVYTVALKPEETAKLAVGDYEYDAGIQYGDNFRPIVAVSTLTVNKSVTERNTRKPSTPWNPAESTPNRKRPCLIRLPRKPLLNLWRC